MTWIKARAPDANLLHNRAMLPRPPPREPGKPAHVDVSTAGCRLRIAASG